MVLVVAMRGGKPRGRGHRHDNNKNCEETGREEWDGKVISCVVRKSLVHKVVSRAGLVK